MVDELRDCARKDDPPRSSFASGPRISLATLILSSNKGFFVRIMRGFCPSVFFDREKPKSSDFYPGALCHLPQMRNLDLLQLHASLPLINPSNI